VGDDRRCRVKTGDQAMSGWKRFKLLAEFLQFLREEKKWWLAPILIILGLMGIFIVLTESSALLPAIYALF
jgi:hypothetical protein